jgi:hypothetical protein
MAHCKLYATSENMQFLLNYRSYVVCGLLLVYDATPFML